MSKRKSSEGAGTPAQRKKAAAEAARAERAEEPPEEEPEDETDAVEGPPPCDPATRDRVAKEMARMLLFAEHAKKGLTRAEIKKAAMPDVKDSRGKVFDYAFSHANEMLKDTFGFKIAPAIGKSVVHQPDAQATQDAEAGTQAGDGEEHGEKGGPQKYFLVSSLVRRPPVAFDPSEKAEAAYRALVLVVIGVIRFASNKLSEEKLWECLKVIGLDKDDKDKKGRFGGNLEDIVLKRMAKEMYISISKAQCEQARTISEGVRAKEEIQGTRWKEVLAQVGLQGAGPSQQTQVHSVRL